MDPDSSSAPLLTGQVAKILDLSPEMVRVLERSGRLRAVKTATGVRLFFRGDVDKLAREREERRPAAAEPVGV